MELAKLHLPRSAAHYGFGFIMRALTQEEVDLISGGRSNGEIAGDTILTISGGFLGFCLSGGNPAGMWVGAEVGHLFANAILA